MPLGRLRNKLVPPLWTAAGSFRGDMPSVAGGAWVNPNGERYASPGSNCFQRFGCGAGRAIWTLETFDGWHSSAIPSWMGLGPALQWPDCAGRRCSAVELKLSDLEAKRPVARGPLRCSPSQQPHWRPLRAGRSKKTLLRNPRSELLFRGYPRFASQRSIAAFR